jgi:hypothetical protein
MFTAAPYEYTIYVMLKYKRKKKIEVSVTGREGGETLKSQEVFIHSSAFVLKADYINVRLQSTCLQHASAKKTETLLASYVSRIFLPSETQSFNEIY